MSNCSPSQVVENVTYFCSVLPVVAVVLGSATIPIEHSERYTMFEDVVVVSFVQWFGFYDPGQGKVKYTLQESALYKKVSDT